MSAKEKAIRSKIPRPILSKLISIFVFVFILFCLALVIVFRPVAAATTNFSSITSMIYGLVPLFIALAIIGFIAGLAEMGHRRER